MVELLRHTLGLCGEHWHPNLLNMSLISFGFLESISYIKYKLKSKKQKLWKHKENF